MTMRLKYDGNNRTSAFDIGQYTARDSDCDIGAGF